VVEINFGPIRFVVYRQDSAARRPGRTRLRQIVKRNSSDHSATCASRASRPIPVRLPAARLVCRPAEALTVPDAPKLCSGRPGGPLTSRAIIMLTLVACISNRIAVTMVE
jgi:hypothetical protein